MYCKECGKQISDDSRFCRYCGSEQDTPSVQIEKVIATKNVADKVEDALNPISGKPQIKSATMFGLVGAILTIFSYVFHFVIDTVPFS